MKDTLDVREQLRGLRSYLDAAAKDRDVDGATGMFGRKCAEWSKALLVLCILHRTEDTPAAALASEILAELQRARAKFPGDNVTTLAMVEEVGELAKATFEESRERVRKEAVQVATMAMRVVLDGDATLDAWRSSKGLDPLTSRADSDVMLTAIECDRAALALAVEPRRALRDEADVLISSLMDAMRGPSPEAIAAAAARLAAFIDRLLNAAPAVEPPTPPWQPIESAPKDGTDVLVLMRDDYADFWGNHHAGRCFVAMHPRIAADGFDPGWNLYPGYGGVPAERIAGWMPLPATPTDEADHG